MRRGELPERLWTELYFQTVHDPAVAPEGKHTMSVFAQYVPYKFADGNWDSRRDEVSSWRIAFPRRVSAATSPTPSLRRGARPARHRAGGRADRRPHLPGRVPAAIHVGRSTRLAHSHGRACISAAHARIPAAASSGQRAQRRDGGAARDRREVGGDKFRWA